MNKKLQTFCNWLLAYDWQYIDSRTADMCIKVLHSNANQDTKESALDLLTYYEGWTSQQLNKLFLSFPKLNEYNQECLVDTQMAMYTEDISPKTATQYVKNLWLLLSGSAYNDTAEWAADDLCEYAHPFALNKAIKHYNNTRHKWKRYFARNYFWSQGLEYSEVKSWGRKKKAQWVKTNAAWLPSPQWCLGDRPIYVYIFTVAKYPDRWGDISLPGTNKDYTTFQKLFADIADGGIESYRNRKATNKKYFDCLASMADKEDNAVHIFCNSHHGSWDIAGNHCQLLYDFDYDQSRHTFVNTPTAHAVHQAVDQAAKKSPNILPIFIGDYCGSGGVAIEKAIRMQKRSKRIRVKSFHPEGWEPPTVPKSLFEGIRRNSREIWMSACRPESFSYDSPDGGCFTLAFRDSFSPSKSFSKIMKQTGRRLMKQGIPSVPWLVCSPGRQRSKLIPKQTR